MEITVRLLRKLKINLPFLQVLPSQGIHPKGIHHQRTTETPTSAALLIAAQFTLAKTWAQPRCPTTKEGMEKRGIYTQWNFSITKKNEFMPSEGNNLRLSFKQMKPILERQISCLLSFVVSIF